MYHYEIDPEKIKNIRLKREIENIKCNSNFGINHIIGNSKHYTGLSNNNKCFDYTINISLNLYDYLDIYLDCDLNYWQAYPFRQPDCYINGRNYRKILYRLNSERYNDEINYGFILKKYINYGFKTCPCCESIFYNNQNNFSHSIEDYVDEIKKVLLCVYYKEKLILARQIMNKYIGIEFEKVYEFLVGKI